MAASPQTFQVEEFIRFASTHEPPQFLPRGDDAASKAVFDLARMWAYDLAIGAIDIDTAYALAKAAAMNLQVHTEGRRRWKATKPFLEWIIETGAARIGAYFEVQDDKALHQLRQVALVAVNRGQTAAAVRAAVIHAAAAMPFPPPEHLLHEAYAWGVAEARRNARWMMMREGASQ